MRFVLPFLLLAATPALAQTGRPDATGAAGEDRPAAEAPAGSERPTIMVEPVGMLIASFDADFDGKVTRAELDAGARRTFAAIDTRGIGRLGYIEFADWSERFLGNRTALPSPFEVDHNGDNQITPDELVAALQHRFDQFDADKDGAVTRAELLTIHDVGGGGSFGGQRRGGGGGHRGGGHRGGGGGGMGRGGGMGG